jgi:hypothetical protein
MMMVLAKRITLPVLFVIAVLAALHYDFVGWPVGEVTGKAILESPMELGPDERRFLSLECDLGVVEPGTVIRREVVVQNTSSTRWSLSKLRGTCSCTVQSFKPKVLEAGETGVLSLTFRAPEFAGPIRREVQVSFEEESSPLVVVMIRGAIHNWAEASPSAIRIGGMLPGAIETRYIDVTAYKPVLELDVASTDLPWMSLRRILDGAMSTRNAESAVTTPTRYILEIRPPIGLTKWRFAGSLSFSSKTTPELELKVPYECNLVAPIVANPNQLFFGYLHPGSASSKSVELSISVEVNAPPIGSIELRHSLGSEFQLTLEPTANARTFSLCGTYTPLPNRGLRSGEVEVILAENVRITIPVRAFVTE